MNNSCPNNKVPSQTRFIIGNEACERFSFYGMRSILAGYMTSYLLIGADMATSLIHLFVAVNYLLPLVGGWLSDKYWGRYKTIFWISLFYCVGHGILATSDLTTSIEIKKWILISGMAVIAMGSGGIKPCVSAFMGDQFAPDQAHLLKKAYAAFYWAINFGSFFAFLIIPWAKDTHGWSWAFAIPGIFMALATFIFWCGRNRYINIPPSATQHHTGIFTIWKHCWTRHQKGKDFWDSAQGTYTKEDIDCARSVIRILKIFALIPVFWALFEQTASSWVLQGEQMVPVVLNIGFITWTIQAAQFQAANPIFVMILIPFITMVIYPRCAWLNSPLRRISVGLFVATLSYGCVAFLQSQVEGTAPISLAWQLTPYLILTTAEILISTTGLEFAFTQAPPRMKSAITSFWNLTIFLGNLLISLITWVLSVEGENNAISTSRFLLYGVLMLVVAILFTWVGKHEFKNTEISTTK